MNFRQLLFPALLLLIGASARAHQDVPRFTLYLDINHAGGMLTLQEIIPAGKPARDVLDRFDVNGDDELDDDERAQWDAWHDRRDKGRASLTCNGLPIAGNSRPDRVLRRDGRGDAQMIVLTRWTIAWKDRKKRRCELFYRPPDSETPVWAVVKARDWNVGKANPGAADRQGKSIPPVLLPKGGVLSFELVYPD
ncbi:MAG: hypothetical protein GMKNLPBB_02765 [Myxococcota bacterium]|nr:hypothetical protein [Myxococcota bacterium]